MEYHIGDAGPVLSRDDLDGNGAPIGLDQLERAVAGNGQRCTHHVAARPREAVESEQIPRHTDLVCEATQGQVAHASGDRLDSRIVFCGLPVDLTN